MPESNKNEPTCAFVHVLTNIHPYMECDISTHAKFRQLFMPHMSQEMCM